MKTIGKHFFLFSVASKTAIICLVATKIISIPDIYRQNETFWWATPAFSPYLLRCNACCRCPSPPPRPWCSWWSPEGSLSQDCISGCWGYMSGWNNSQHTDKLHYQCSPNQPADEKKLFYFSFFFQFFKKRRPVIKKKEYDMPWNFMKNKTTSE